MTAADILTLKPAMIQDGYIVWQRCKLAKIKEGGKVKDYRTVAILRGHTGLFHAASLGKSAFAAVEAGP